MIQNTTEASAAPRTLVVIPSKDNAGSITQVVTQCLRHSPDVLLVDDGCVDQTAHLAKQAGATVLSHPTNLGKGAALVSAMRYAQENGFSHIVAIDADGQHEADDLPEFFEQIIRFPHAIIAGKRDMRTAPGSSRFGMRFSNFWIWVETGHAIGDSQCGFRAYPVSPVLALNMRPGRYEWEVEVLVRAIWSGTGVNDLPCRVFYPDPSERVSSFRPVLDNVRITLLNIRLIIERIVWPPRWINRVRS